MADAWLGIFSEVLIAPGRTVVSADGIKTEKFVVNKK
jgi:hypothetical protein